MSKYQAYPKYEPINAEWLSEIPIGWSTTPLKYVASINMGQSPSSEDCNIDGIGVPFLQGNAEFGVKSPTEKQFCPIPKKVAKAGDLLFSVRAPVGSLNFANKDFGIGRGLCSIRGTNAISQSFLWWVLPSYKYQFDAIATGSTFEAVSAEEVGNLNLALPPILEQTQIANFLDHETAKIDTLIEKQQQLIKLLKEKRQAVISHAVTKGLNPQAPMKDSGVEWLGEVPEHWDRIKLKHITNQIVDAEHKTAPYFDDGEYLVCRTTNVRDGKLRIEGGKYTDSTTYEEWTKRGKPEIGDILFTREAPAGEACIFTGEVPLCLGQRMVLFKLDKTRVSPEFVLHSIYSGLADDFVKQLSQGSTVAHFNMADIQNIPLFEPSLDEQAQIVEYLSKVLAKYDDLTSSAFKTIALMQERRTALISAAVTGKIDVRDWQAPTSQNQELEQTA
ncbi:putative type I restriction-modification system specificity determinant [Vibrio diabolicus E0666]|uniref:restriction endonuclease subunit S n=1 Tax=Vibrio TaxID=662 RepID=UPI0002B70C40|nr:MULTISPECIES: restriction endonuclease subunit S [Vibrio]EGR2700274.1 restriction endonuclease subunit S [Vibrio parahaemolyticus]EMD78547.1 putative type I restriction-modification system specificity determinant [Vibrio diabolicus E0666]MDW2115998.1 restriction endonuclease subunit S [Vibrio sp. 1731]